MDELLDVRNVCKSYGTRLALSNVSFSVSQGESIVIVGNNGAGKSTLLKLLSGLQRPDRGTISVSDSSYAASLRDRDYRSKLGYIEDEGLLYQELSIRENLRLSASLYSVQNISGEIEKITDRLGLRPNIDARVSTCSRGVKRRAAIARALIHQPRLLLLDEPFANLDFSARTQLFDLLECLQEGGVTGLVATNEPGVKERLGQRVLTFQGGKLLSDSAASIGESRISSGGAGE